MSMMIRRFDVVAVQGIQDRNHAVLVGLLEQINTEGRRYDFAAAESLQPDPVRPYTAFLFNRATVQIDRGTVALVEDSTFFLIERLAQAVADHCLEHPLIHSARVTLDKPGALRFARSVAVEIHRRKNGEGS